MSRQRLALKRQLEAPSTMPSLQLDLKVDPKFTSQICSRCGQVRKKDLSEHRHQCDCGAELDRDVNAAINILDRGKQHLGGKRPMSATA